MDSMDLWTAYQNVETGEFGAERVYLSTGTRWNMSLKKAEAQSLELEMGQAIAIIYNENRRYVLARDIIFDLFMSIYDVNTRNAMVMRTARPFKDSDIGRITDFVRSLGSRPNLEIRCIGLQDKQDLIAANIHRLLNTFRYSALVEVDIFGEELRHVSLDLYTGMSYNLLLLNRIYRPGELINKSTVKSFSDLVFVETGVGRAKRTKNASFK